MADEVDSAFVEKFLVAWDKHDVDGILDMMTDDIVFESSFGSEQCGKRFSGKAEARKAIERVYATFPQTRFEDPRWGVVGDRGFAEWTMSHVDASGQRVAVRGCDLFIFKSGKVSRKDSYRKNRV